MSSLALVITMLLLTSAEGDAAAAVPWKEEGEVPAWSDGGVDTKTVDRYLWEAGCKEHPKNHRPTIQTAQNLKKV